VINWFQMEKTPNKQKSLSLKVALPWLLIILGAIALLASIMLSIEVFDRLKNPSYVPVCNLNPVLSCTSVADSNQAHAFGFPNYFIGIAGYGIVMAAGGAILAANRLKRWFWLTLNVGLLLAAVFLHWLIFQTLYRIGALCIFCMVVWATTIPMLWYLTLHNLDTKAIKTPRRLRGVIGFARRHHGDILLGWFLLIIVLILKRFWYYWSGLV
jgi:uncharacterized membrane protein